MAAMILRVLYLPLTPSDQVIMDALPGGARAGKLAQLGVVTAGNRPGQRLRLRPGARVTEELAGRDDSPAGSHAGHHRVDHVEKRLPVPGQPQQAHRVRRRG